MQVPASYQPTSPPEIPGLSLEDPAAYAPSGARGEGTSVTLGTAQSEDATLLPKGLRNALGLERGEVPDRTAVRLGEQELEAFRYAGLEPEGLDGTLTLYAAPTSAGVATVACVAAPGAAEGFQAECDGIANTLAVPAGEEGLQVGPDPDYAKTVSGALGRPRR